MGEVIARESVKIPLQSLINEGFEVKPFRRITEEEFLEFCVENPEMRIEQDKNGKLIIMPPVDYDGGIAEEEVLGQLHNWRTQYGKGKSFSPTTGFRLPDGSTRSADGAWANPEKIATVTPKQRKKFAPFAPDFVIEIRSSSDRIGKLKKKMTDTWLANGVRLAWLLDPKTKKSYIYRPGRAVEELNGFDRLLSGEDVCPGFELDLRKLL